MISCVIQIELKVVSAVTRQPTVLERELIEASNDAESLVLSMKNNWIFLNFAGQCPSGSNDDLVVCGKSLKTITRFSKQTKRKS